MVNMEFLIASSSSSCGLTLLEQMFDLLPSAQFFVKDRHARYLVVNQAMADHAGTPNKSDLIGLTCEEVFPTTPKNFSHQDLQIIDTGINVINALEMCVSKNFKKTWCISSKFKITEHHESAALVGISRMLPTPQEKQGSYSGLTNFIDYVKKNCGTQILLAEAARNCKLSVDSLERLTRDIFGLTPRQVLTQIRMEQACKLLERTSLNINEIGRSCGYTDNSAFSRQFKSSTHFTPQEYRNASIHLTRRISL